MNELVEPVERADGSDRGAVSDNGSGAVGDNGREALGDGQS